MGPPSLARAVFNVNKRKEKKRKKERKKDRHLFIKEFICKISEKIF